MVIALVQEWLGAALVDPTAEAASSVGRCFWSARHRTGKTDLAMIFRLLLGRSDRDSIGQRSVRRDGSRCPACMGPWRGSGTTSSTRATN